MATLVKKNNYTTLLVSDIDNLDFSSNDGYLYVNDNKEVIFAGRELNLFLAYVPKDEDVTSLFVEKYGEVDHIQYVDSAWSGRYDGRVIEGVDYEIDEYDGEIITLNGDWYRDGSAIKWDGAKEKDILYIGDEVALEATSITYAADGVHILTTHDYDNYGIAVDGQVIKEGFEFLYIDDETNEIKDIDDMVIYSL